LHPGKDETRDGPGNEQSKTSSRKTRLHNQLQKKYSHSIKNSGVSGLCVQQQSNDGISTVFEDYQPNEEDSTVAYFSKENVQMDSRSTREDDFHYSSSRRSSITHKIPTTGHVENITPDSPELESNLQIVKYQSSGVTLVGTFTTQKNGLPIQRIQAENPKTIIHVDASNSGWGVSSELITASGFWNQEEKNHSINVRELKTILFAIQHHAVKCKNSTIKIYSDNITALKYTTKSGGTTSMILQDLAIQIQEICNQHNIKVMHQHIPGILNTQADMLSRLRKPLNWFD
jgi:hypothetical protein